MRGSAGAKKFNSPLAITEELGGRAHCVEILEY
jgi:hypothetical protein